METIKLTGKIIEGNCIGAPLQSCKSVDVPTKRRGIVEVDGIAYERTVYERIRWRNSAKNDVRASFVIVNGTNYAVEG